MYFQLVDFQIFPREREKHHTITLLVGFKYALLNFFTFYTYWYICITTSCHHLYFYKKKKNIQWLWFCRIQNYERKIVLIKVKRICKSYLLQNVNFLPEIKLSVLILIIRYAADGNFTGYPAILLQYVLMSFYKKLALGV